MSPGKFQRHFTQLALMKDLNRKKLFVLTSVLELSLTLSASPSELSRETTSWVLPPFAESASAHVAV
jgi:hypothetical protein